MRFLVNKTDYDINREEKTPSKENQIKLTAATSVNILKDDFFNTLVKLGELVQIEESIDQQFLEKLCAEDDVIYVCMNSEPIYEIKCRLLAHSLGSLLATGGFLHKWYLVNSTLNLVTSQKQKLQLQNSLGKTCFNLGVFTPNISLDTFYFNSDRLAETRNNAFRIVYAGRLIANKGIIQTIRALNLYPINNAEFSLIGDFEPNFLIYQSNSYNTTFSNFFIREGLKKSPHLGIKIKSSLDRKYLKKEYWQSDCFVYPSFHEDENFGLAPREAILSGIPVVVSDFCGLGNLENTSGFAVKTYPSLAGLRYSIKELADCIHKISNRTNEEKQTFACEDSKFVKDECNRQTAKKDLIEAIENLKSLPLSTPQKGGWRSQDRVERWVESENPLFKKAAGLKDEPLMDGLYVDGTGFLSEGRWFSDAHFMQAIQSIYTTFPTPPKAQKNNIYRGFWRTTLWEQECAVVEFGFPGQRTIRFSDDEFEALKSCYQTLGSDEGIFVPKNEKHIILIQKLIDLGYVVPDEL